tara:strand:- start:743 stop:1393 length:651 start_codon:yes stop_codon:yes gene_type:complete
MSNNFIAHTDDPTHPFLTCDNWFTPKEEEQVWKELDFFTNEDSIDHSSNGPVALDAKGNQLASNFRVYPEDIYTLDGRDISAIFRFKDKLAATEINDFIYFNMTPGPFNCYKGSNRDSTLISYYHAGDYYKSHHDAFQFTILIWFTKEPKCYSGGEFYFTDAKIHVPNSHNKLLIFPSYLNHAVTPIEFKTPKPLGYGRYTITHFFYTVPTGVVKK